MTVSQFPEPQTPKHRSRVLTVMSEMRAAGYGYENIYVDLNAMGFPISRDACRRFVIPKITTAPRGASGGRKSRGLTAATRTRH